MLIKWVGMPWKRQSGHGLTPIEHGHVAFTKRDRKTLQLRKYFNYRTKLGIEWQWQWQWQPNSDVRR